MITAKQVRAICNKAEIAYEKQQAKAEREALNQVLPKILEDVKTKIMAVARNRGREVNYEFSDQTTMSFVIKDLKSAGYVIEPQPQPMTIKITW